MTIAVNFQFRQLERRSLKTSGLQRDSNPWPPRYRCDAPPTELWSHTLRARSIYWVHNSREEWNDVKYKWNNSYFNCGCRWKWRMILAVNFQFRQLERRSLKTSGLQRNSNPWPMRCRCDTLPTELWSHTLGARSIYWVHIFPCSEVMWSIYEIIHISTAVVDELNKVCMNSINWTRSKCVAS